MEPSVKLASSPRGIHPPIKSLNKVMTEAAESTHGEPDER